MKYIKYEPWFHVILKVYYQGDIMYRTLIEHYDGWRVSSPISEVVHIKDSEGDTERLELYNESGSLYDLTNSKYKTSPLTVSVLNSLMESTVKQLNASVIMFESFEEFLEDFNEYKESEENASRDS